MLSLFTHVAVAVAVAVVIVKWNEPNWKRNSLFVCVIWLLLSKLIISAPLHASHATNHRRTCALNRLLFLLQLPLPLAACQIDTVADRIEQLNEWSLQHSGHFSTIFTNMRVLCVCARVSNAAVPHECPSVASNEIRNSANVRMAAVREKCGRRGTHRMHFALNGENHGSPWFNCGLV